MKMERFAFRVGPYKNGVVGMLTLRAAAQQHGSENVQSERSSFRRCIHFLSFPYPDKMRL